MFLKSLKQYIFVTKKNDLIKDKVKEVFERTSLKRIGEDTETVVPMDVINFFLNGNRTNIKKEI